jgi:hypothetical protein
VVTNALFYWVLGYWNSKHAGFLISGGALYATVHDGTTETNELISGIATGTAHKYEVHCIAGGFKFYVDDVLQVTISTGLPTGKLTTEFTPLLDLYVKTLDTTSKQFTCSNFWASRTW